MGHGLAYGRHSDWSLRRLPCHEELQKGLGCGRRRGRILSRDEAAIHDRKALPIGRLLVEAAESLQFILNKEGHGSATMATRHSPERTRMRQPNTRAVCKVRYTTIVSRSAARVMPV
jgi:hypothetical protein